MLDFVTKKVAALTDNGDGRAGDCLAERRACLARVHARVVSRDVTDLEQAPVGGRGLDEVLGRGLERDAVLVPRDGRGRRVGLDLNLQSAARNLRTGVIVILLRLIERKIQ